MKEAHWLEILKPLVYQGSKMCILEVIIVRDEEVATGGCET
jgi:hypothetical protein